MIYRTFKLKRSILKFKKKNFEAPVAPSGFNISPISWLFFSQTDQKAASPYRLISFHQYEFKTWNFSMIKIKFLTLIINTLNPNSNVNLKDNACSPDKNIFIDKIARLVLSFSFLWKVELLHYTDPLTLT